ncbi:WXG100 family type VII secretion target [Glycomyces buryatensis]|uniref:PPE domain-containing protein n=1 Tax=Glycomyces buryatensis TaxID=2570927 RepID=A0A4S8QCD7_9ACTN|nr:hypothetical protein [Glycomyces buryatensis]THV40642.1 hypothetical protein FAB82_15385 [Glycomyces buryatensis]
MAEAKGFDYYRNHTTTELWAMLAAGDAWSVEQSAGVWRTARHGLEAARGSLQTNLEGLTGYWQGPASEEFQSRMFLVHDYSAIAEERMRTAEETHIPDMVTALQTAQSRAQGENDLGEDLHPDNDIPDPDDWMHEVKNLSYDEIAKLEPQTRNTYTAEHSAWQQARHDELAQTVADLGTQYAAMADKHFAEPAAPPPEGMPGNSTYQQPTTGVFAPTTIDSSATTASSGSALQPEASVDSDEDDVASPWDVPSYTDIDEPSGGLASGGTPTPGPPVGPSSTTVPGGNPLPAGTPGLFNPGRPTTGGAPGRTPGTAGPVRGTQPTSPGRGTQPATPNRGGQPGTPGRGTSGRTTSGRGGLQPNQPSRQGSTAGRGTGTGTRTGAGPGKNGSPGANNKRRNDEAEEEETTAKESKYVKAEDVFAVPFDPAVGPAHEGAKHQRAWNKEHDAWKRRQEEEGEADA